MITLETFRQGIEEILPAGFEKELFNQKKPLTVKWGADPSAPDLHLGHMVVLNKLRQLQQAGFTIIFLIGDFTATIGDPTGKSETRKSLTAEEVVANAKTYQDQVFKILDRDKTQVVYNSTWLDKLSARDIVGLTAKYNVARMLERDDFNKRFRSNQSISLHEFLYPLLQGYDSVVLENDIEIGGTDQKFNLLVGRHLQREYGKREQAIITVSILEGLDGSQKMSKSLGNHIGITEEPGQMFGKLMSIPDHLIIRYFKLLTDKTADEIRSYEDRLRSGVNPKLIKEELGKHMVALLHNKEAAENAAQEFNRVFSEGHVPDDMPEIQLAEDARLDDLLIHHQLAPSKKESHRLIKQGAVSINGEKQDDPFFLVTSSGEELIIKVGKRKWLKIKKSA